MAIAAIAAISALSTSFGLNLLFVHILTVSVALLAHYTSAIAAIAANCCTFSAFQIYQ